MSEPFVIDIGEFDPAKIVFDDPKAYEVKTTKAVIKYYLIPIFYLDGGKKKKLLFNFKDKFCFGVKEFADGGSKSVSIVLYDKEKGPTNEDTEFIKGIQALIEKCKKELKRVNSLKDTKKNLKVHFPEEEILGVLPKLNKFLYQKKDDETGEKTDSPPSINAKLMEKKIYSGNKMVGSKCCTAFYLKNKSVSPLKYIDKPFQIEQGIIKLDSIYVGSTACTIQTKIEEAIITEAKTSNDISNYLKKKLNISESDEVEGDDKDKVDRSDEGELEFEMDNEEVECE